MADRRAEGFERLWAVEIMNLGFGKSKLDAFLLNFGTEFISMDQSINQSFKSQRIAGAEARGGSRGDGDEAAAGGGGWGTGTVQYRRPISPSQCPRMCRVVQMMSCVIVCHRS